MGTRPANGKNKNSGHRYSSLGLQIVDCRLGIADCGLQIFFIIPSRHHVTLSEAKGLPENRDRCFAALSMTCDAGMLKNVHVPKKL